MLAWLGKDDWSYHRIRCTTPEPPALPRLAHPPPHTDHPCIAPPPRPPQGKQYYEYTCCPDDEFTQGEECGDYDPGIDAGGVVFGILFMLLLLIGITCGILGCCYGCPGCPWYQSYVDRAGMRVRVGVMGSITAAHTLGQPVLRRLLPSPDDTPGCPRLWPAPG